jgi:hypothetical protein
MELNAAAIQDVSVIPVVVNTVDRGELSVSSVGPIPETVDSLGADKDTVKEVETATDEKTDAEKQQELDLQQAELDKQQAKAKEKDPDQHRIDVLTKARRSAERERDEERTKRLALEEELKTAKKSIPAKDKPKLDDFEGEAEFLEALADWKVDQKLRDHEEQTTKATRESTEKKAIDEEYEALDSKMEKGRDKYPDFNELVLDENLKLSEAVIEAVLFSDIAEDVLYYLGKHPDESARISKLPAMKAAHELGKIEAKLTAPPPKKKTTQAPDPIIPVATTGAIDKDPGQMTPREYREWREKTKK